jgi:prepilin-type N-terminal cleavage/methylation domain-containing protein
MRRKSGFTIVELIIVTVIVLLLAAIVTPSFIKAKNEPKVFAAWVKQTGNPKGLTFKEWRMLYREPVNSQGNPVIIIQ